MEILPKDLHTPPVRAKMGAVLNNVLKENDYTKEGDKSKAKELDEKP